MSASLIERLHATPGPDRDLDLLTYCAATGEAWEWVEPHPTLNADRLWAKPAGDLTVWRPGEPMTIYQGSTAAKEGWGGMRNVPRFTASVDAALALVQQVLPQHGYSVRRFAPGVKPVATLYAPPEAPDAPIDDGRSWSRHIEGTGANSALAVLSALLTAVLGRQALASAEEKRG